MSAVDGLTGKQLRKIYDDLPDRAKAQVANLALNLKHIPEAENVEPDIEALVKEWKVVGAKLTLDLLSTTDDESAALVTAADERRCEIEDTLSEASAKNEDEVSALLYMARDMLRQDELSPDAADAVCGMISSAADATSKLLRPCFKDARIELEDGTRQLRPRSF